jgi:hypothetical protein
MVLNEKHNEQSQQKWSSRVKRERMNLSASVEESLEDTTADELVGGEEAEERGGSSRSGQGRGVFPPRLSLQSRSVPALRTDISHETNVNASPVLPVAQEQEREPAPLQNTNILKRFAQRLTSSFAAIGGHPQLEVIEPPGLSLEEEGVQSESVPVSKEVDEGIQQVQGLVEPLLQERGSSQRPIPSDDSDDGPRDRQSKQRLAGRATRIHLETPPRIVPTTLRQPEEAKTETASSNTLQRANSIDVNEPLPRVENNMIGLPTAVSTGSDLQEIANSTGSSLPTPSQRMPVGANTTGARLPAVDAMKGKSGGAARRELSGSGVFEPGQGDATIVNRYVTEASVVLVTLTANPGPVVIQYVTLRPRIGFTVHLTAPTTMRASFNYIVLLGELF